MFTVLYDDHGIQHKQFNTQTGFHMREAYRFALRKVNERRILYGINLSEKIMHTEGKIKHDEIFFSFYVGNPKPIISPVEPYTSFQVSILTEALGNPLITYSYSSGNAKQPGFIFRATAPDHFKLSATVAVIKTLGWNYISLISSSGKSGETLAKEVIKHVYEANICYARSLALPSEPTLTDYRNAVREVASGQAMGLLLITNNRDSLGLATAMKQLSMKGKFQILALGGFANYIEIAKGKEEYLQGAIIIEEPSEEINEFRDHFLTLKVDMSDHASVAFWEETFACRFNAAYNSTLGKCTGHEEILPGHGYHPMTPVAPIINSVFALAYAARGFMHAQCSMSLKSPPCSIKQLRSRREKERYFKYLREYLLNNSFADSTLNVTDPLTMRDPSIVKFDILNYVDDGKQFASKKIGSWTHRRKDNNFPANYGKELQIQEGVLVLNVSKIQWINHTGLVLSSCRLPCRDGEVHIPHDDAQKSQCCWHCVKCGLNMISVNNSCVDCGQDLKPDSRKMFCVTLEVRYFGIDRKSRKAIWAYIGLSAFGIISATSVLIMFIKHSGNIVVRSSGRELCYVILTGIYLLFSMPMTFLLAPSSVVCSVHHLLPGIALCACYAPLFLKVNRIYRIFVNAQSTTARTLLTSPRSQLFMVACFVSIQLVLGIVWIVSEVPGPVKMYRKTEGYVVYSCNNEALPLVLNLILSVGLMCCCTWYAFKTRNFPKNYSESRYIGFTMYFTSLCWALFLPTYFLSNSNDAHTHEHLVCVLAIVIAFVSLVGLFGQRVQMLLMPSKVQRQRQFSQLSRQEANPNKCQVRTYSLKTLTLTKQNDKSQDKKFNY